MRLVVKFLAPHVKNDQFWLLMVDLIDSSPLVVDKLIDIFTRTFIVPVLHLATMGIAGGKHRSVMKARLPGMEPSGLR